MTDGDGVAINFDESTLLDILKHAASQDRTVVEFRTVGSGDDRRLEQIADITAHVEELESQYE